MKVRRLYLENFKIHKSKEINFDLSKNLIIGENGTGKSTIFHAIIFSLFGGDKAILSSLNINRIESLIRHLSPSLKVILELEDSNGGVYRIIRTVSSSGESKAVIEMGDGKILATTPDIVNRKIYELLKITNPSKIIEILYIKQGDLGKLINISGKVEFTNKLEELFDIKLYSMYLDVVQGVIRDLNKELNYLEREKEMFSKDIEEFNKIFGGLSKEELEKIYTEFILLRKRREEIYKSYVELKTLYSSIDSKKISQEKYIREKLKELEERYNELNERLSNLKAEKYNLKFDKYSKELLDKDIDFLKSLLLEIENKIKGLDKLKLMLEINNLKEKKNILEEYRNLIDVKRIYEEKKNILEELEKKQIEIKNKIETINKSLEILKFSKDKICPVCKKPLIDEEYKNLLLEYENELNNLKVEKENIEKEIFNYKKEVKNLEKDYTRFQYLDKKIIELGIDLNQLSNELEAISKRIEDIDQKIRLFEEYEIINGTINYLKSRDIERAINLLNQEINNLKNEINNLLKEISQIESMKKNLEKYNQILQSLGFNSLFDLENEIKKIDEELKKYENFKPELYRIYLEKLEKYNILIEKIRKIRKNIQLLNYLQNSLIKFIERIRKEKTLRLSEEFRRFFKRLYRYGDISDVKIDLEINRSGEKIFNIIIAKEIDGKILYKNVNEAGLSGGQTKILDLALRLAIASIINPNFKVLMLDEPTESLDENVRYQLAELLDSLEGYQIILCTHDELFKEKISGKVIEFRRST
ncbi:MAG: SMC family ATPase [Nanopusillaceae archaeon]